MADTADERAALLPAQQTETAASSPWRDSLTHAWQQTTHTVRQWTASLSAHGSGGNGGGDGEVEVEEDEDALEHRRQRKAVWHRRAHVAGVALFAVVLALLVFGAIILGHLFMITLRAPSQEKQAAILARSLTLKGPDRLSVLNLTSEGIHVQLDARLGLDPDDALDEWLGVRGSRSAWQNFERRWLEWSFRQVKGVRIDVTGVVLVSEPDYSKNLPSKRLHLIDAGKHKNKSGNAHDDDETVFTNSGGDDSEPPADLLGFDIEPLYIRIPPLRASRSARSRDASGDDEDPDQPTHRASHNLTPLNLTLLLKPLSPIPRLVSFGEAAVNKRKVTLDLNMPGLLVRGLGEYDLREGERRKAEGRAPVGKDQLRTGWGVASWIALRQGQSGSRVTEDVPDVKPGKNSTDLLKLTHYDFFEINGDSKASTQPKDKAQGLAAIQNAINTMATRALGIRADAIAKNPLGKLLHGYVRYQLPFGIYLPIEAEEPPAEPPTNSSITTKKAKVPKHGDPDDTSSVLMAVVATEPLILDGAKHIPLKLEGRVVPPPPPSKDAVVLSSTSSTGQQVHFAKEATSSADEVRIAGTPQEKALSNFLSKFLRGDANTVYVRGGSPWSRGPPSLSTSRNATEVLPGNGSPDLPDWIGSALGLVDVPISFPGSKVTDLIKDVTIQNLRFAAHPFEKERILCSGTVMGTLNLPKELGGVDVKITQLWPDILVFDGKPPSLRKPHHGDGDGDDGGDGDGDGDSGDDDDYYDDDGVDKARYTQNRMLSRRSKKSDDPPTEPEPEPPLPSPLPDGAFGRLRPHDFTPAITEPDPTDPSGARKLLRCELVNVPFNVLPERQKEFRAFAWKILTGGATAGIEGSARARIWNSGLGLLELKNLPVKGTFPVAPPSVVTSLKETLVGLTS
ncbi:unnamed protein product [Tilletia controversa]|uniref:Uncharacterized protein n=3 Tax=Tilletia TaxID=13289 RepID=A0A8X7MW80_9BASI|nr:hypothetical protein CF336_g2579 [Tilletia laevis]KAE8202131.1 hypothetical protein CF328_g2390 [Tilletia controversa]KAE8263596.1 hypothetical protein A4X03_0g1560 [Tilletia caries]KAE8206620.1 hypothetical protein CF335_g1748 [Tilletia laevis]KAE8249865.1 hypothetical protein A4X06_0g3029 [Tilletia controversa]